MKLWYNFHFFPNLLFWGKTSQSPNVVLSRRQLTPPSVSKPAIRLCRSAVRIICLQKVYSLNIVWENNCNHNRLLSKKREKENNENIWLVGMHFNLETLDRWWYYKLIGGNWVWGKVFANFSVYRFPNCYWKTSEWLDLCIVHWVCAFCFDFLAS